MAKDLISKLVYMRKYRYMGLFSYYLLKLLGVEIPLKVKIGEDLEITHGGFGIVIHPYTKIGKRVKIYPGVTLGRSDIYKPIEVSKFEGIQVGNDVILSTGCKIIGKEGLLMVGEGSVIGANAVLLNSTGDWEIWAGVPAKKIGERDRK
jgi:serine O-acetyltransferase